MNKVLSRILMAAVFILTPAFASARVAPSVGTQPAPMGGSTNFGNQ